MSKMKTIFLRTNTDLTKDLYPSNCLKELFSICSLNKPLKHFKSGCEGMRRVRGDKNGPSLQMFHETCT